MNSRKLNNINQKNGIRFDNNGSNINTDDYYLLEDIKHKHNIKCKNIFEIIRSKEEFIMIINKILSKYKGKHNLAS